MKHALRIVAWIGAGVLLIPGLLAQEYRGAPPATCGLKSLDLLLRLEGRDVDLSSLGRRLSPPGDAGYSLQQWRNGARMHGVAMRGTCLNAGHPLDGAAIVFLNGGGHGHFVVLRPIGHTGKLVQVIDPNEPPRVLDIGEIDRLPRWTGLALVVDGERDGRLFVAVPLIASVGGICLYWALKRKLQGRDHQGEGRNGGSV